MILNNKEGFFFLSNEKNLTYIATWDLQHVYSHQRRPTAIHLAIDYRPLGTILNISPSLARARPSELIENFARSIGLRGSGSGISQPHLSERRSSLRRTTSVLSKRSDVSQHAFRQFRPSHRPACAMTMFPIPLYISQPTLDRHADDLSRLVWSRGQMLRFTMTNNFADARASVRIDKSRVRIYHGI